LVLFVNIREALCNLVPVLFLKTPSEKEQQSSISSVQFSSEKEQQVVWLMSVNFSPVWFVVGFLYWYWITNVQ